MIALLSGYARFNDIQRRVTGISARVLSSELKKLELNLLIQRKVDVKSTPIVVEYTPTSYSSSLKNIIDTLADWGAAHKKKITEK